jgi:hypothetical protein
LSKPFLTAALGIAFCVVGCGHHHRSADSVIAAALRSNGGPFPRREGQRPCVIHGGGPSPGTAVRATCRTHVVFHGDDTATVLFTHFIGGKPHTWEYAVSRSLRVRFVRQYGPGPAPEYEA